MSTALAACTIRLRSSHRRTAGAAAVVAVAGLLLGTAITVGYGLTTGFDRAADRADLPDVIARFDQRSVAAVDRTLRALPNLHARSYRFEATGLGIGARDHATEQGAAEVVGPGRRGYAVIAGRDVAGAGREVVVERGLARAWGLHLGDALRIRRLASFRIVGIALDPENVAYPLASQAHVWLPVGFFARRRAARLERTNVALLWLADRSRSDVTLQQARTASFAFGGLRLLTRSGIGVQLHEAAGVVVALLAAVSLVAAVAAGVLLGAGAHADVQRSLATLGVQRALGFPAAALAAGWGLAGAAVALPAGALGLGAGALLAHHPTASLLGDLNELAPGFALLGPLAAALGAIVVVVALAMALPAWRALCRPPVRLLRGAELASARRARGLLGAGPALLGARLVLARRARAGSTIAVLAATGSVLALLLALATLLSGLRNDPGALGRRYQLSVPAPAHDAAAIARVPGVLAAAPRYAVDAAASFSLQEPIRLIAFPGDHTPFEAPPLATGRRLRSADEVEVGQGLADALGLRVGGTLAVQTSGGELRLRVAGVVRALEHDGRVAYLRSARLLRLVPDAPEVVAIRLRPGADTGAVRRAVAATTGIAPGAPGTATPRSRAFLRTLAAVVRVLAGVVGGVSLLALAQALAVTARERRATIAVLRAGGAGTATIARLLAGAVAVLLVPGAVLGLVLERWVLGPAVTSLAAGYADLSLAPTAGQVAIAGAAFALLAALAIAVTLRRVLGEAITTGLRLP